MCGFFIIISLYFLLKIKNNKKRNTVYGKRLKKLLLKAKIKMVYILFYYKCKKNKSYIKQIFVKIRVIFFQEYFKKIIKFAGNKQIFT